MIMDLWIGVASAITKTASTVSTGEIIGNGNG